MRFEINAESNVIHTTIGQLFMMKNRFLSHICLSILTVSLLTILASAQQKPATDPPKSSAEPPPKTQEVDRSKLPLASRPNLSLADVNTSIGVDKRSIVMMAALNLAGYDYEPGNRAVSGVRQMIREDLKGLNPELIRRIRNHYLAHSGGKKDATSVAPYLSLALSMTEPPAFNIDVPPDRLPEDVREITDFALLLEEFYRESGFSKLLPKYIAEYTKVAQGYGPAAGLALGTVLVYLHTEPVLELPPLFIPRPTAAELKKKKDKDKGVVPPVVIPNRIRQFVIIPDLLNASGAANLRVVRDAYFLLLGPSTELNIEAIRRSFLSFVIDPLTERQIKEVAAIRGKLRNLMESRKDHLDKEYASRSAYFLLSDSLVRAIDARMEVLGLATRRQSSEDEAIYDLSLGYDRGAVLVYHFYNQIKAFEAVGVNIRDYFSSMLGNIDFDLESKRLDEYSQRLARVKQLRTEATLAPPPPATISNADEKMVGRIVEADQMIKAKKYDDAKAVLEAALRENPNNARVLFGLADVTSKKATSLTDSDRVEEALYAAIEYYKLAAKNASPDTEKWLSQRSYVAMAKILDFIAENNPAVADQMSADAAAAYDLALKLGKVEGGAYEEAEAAIKLRGQKAKPQ
jgi:hypothetical protein